MLALQVGCFYIQLVFHEDINETLAHLPHEQSEVVRSGGLQTNLYLRHREGITCHLESGLLCLWV